jgi:large subunit ribosomal protein L4
MISAALRGALSDRARAGRGHVVEALSIDGVPSTKIAARRLAELTAGKHALVVVGNPEGACAKSVRNLPGVHSIGAAQLNAYDVLVADDIVFTRPGYDILVAAGAADSEVTA